MKWLTLIMLVLVVFSMTACTSTTDGSSEITEDEIFSEVESAIDDSLMDEEDSVEIGEMI
ncbi:hypothetical protein KY321_05210 [Candidatus Woesearchaeota archaeon]|nr:hypothetical protein [Candidatus Woesearchaeota archaeon]